MAAAKETMGTAYEKAAAVEGIVQEKVKERMKNSFYNQDKDPHFTGDFTGTSGSGRGGSFPGGHYTCRGCAGIYGQ